MANTTVTVFLEAVDKASAVFNRLGNNITQSAGKSSQQIAAMAATGGSLQTVMTRLVAGTATLSAGLGVLALSSGALVNVLKPLTSASIELENSLLGLSSIAQGFGQSAGGAKDAAVALASDGLMSVNEAADGLKNLLATGFNLEQATNLMIGFKDSAAFGRQGTLEFGEAIKGATSGVRNMLPQLLDNAGIVKNLSIIMKQMGGTIEDLANIQNDANARTKLYNGLLKEMAVFQGDAGRLAGTLSGQFSKLEIQTFLLKAALGDALRPAIRLLADMFGDTLAKALVFVNKNTVALAVGFTQLTGFAVHTANVILGAALLIMAAFASIVNFDFSILAKTWNGVSKRIVDNVDSTAKRVADIYENGVGKIEDTIRDMAEGQVNAESKKAEEIAKQLEKETRKYETELQKRERSFEDSLSRLIWAHIDKRDSIIDDLEEESQKFKEKMDEQDQRFAESMDKRKEDFEEQKTEILKKIDEENAEATEKVEERIGKLREQLDKETLAYDDKTKKTIKLLENEQKKGIDASERRLYALQQRLGEEKTDYADKKTEILKQIAEETAGIEKDRAERVSDLEEKLGKETKEYEDFVSENTARHEQETAKVKEEHEERKEDLESKLKEEQTILDRHAGDVAAVKEKEREDDIQRLKRQFEEENVARQEEHEHRVKEIREKGEEEGDAFGAGFANIMGDYLKQVAEEMKKSAEEGTDEMVNEMGKTIEKKGPSLMEKLRSWSLKYFWPPILGGLRNMNFEETRTWLQKLLSQGVPWVGPNFGSRSRGAGDQLGGTVPGPLGQPRAILAHGGEVIHPAGYGGGGNFNITINNPVVRDSSDIARMRNVVIEALGQGLELSRVGAR